MICLLLKLKRLKRWFMSVIINVTGAGYDSDEYQAAEVLKNILQNSLPQCALGEIVISANVTLVGQAVKDIDIIVIGNLQNCNIELTFLNQEGGLMNEYVEITGFCTTVEVKSHDISGVSRQGTELYVSYGLDNHSVTFQSNAQKTSTMNFFKRIFGSSPYITNLIWFIGISSKELINLLIEDECVIPSNALPVNFNVKDFFQLIVAQNKVYKQGGIFKFGSSLSGDSVVNHSKQLRLFNEYKKGVGELTRKRVEQIGNKSFGLNLTSDFTNCLSIYRGRAGTGKTMGLIQTAISLTESDCRVIILTYNRALVSDMRRLFALADLPDLFNENCVFVNTMHSYFFRLISEVIYDGNLSSETFLNEYVKTLECLFGLLSEENSFKYIKDICRKSSYLNWDYVFIDEAQDWMDIERNIITRLFKSSQIIVADGGQQFVRQIEVCDWTEVSERKSYKLKICLRQKINLVKFINHYNEKTGGYGNRIIPLDKLVGGKVYILDKSANIYEFHKQLMNDLIKAGNIAYDMLYFVPSTMVEISVGKRNFIYKDEFEKNNIYLWDGTNEDNRSDYSICTDEVRVLQYDSARGLEGWTVVCMNFDEFLEQKRNSFVPKTNKNALLLESPEEELEKYILNWALIPLTRAIDTLVITLKDIESKTAKQLRELSLQYPDYINWIG